MAKDKGKPKVVVADVGNSEGSGMKILKMALAGGKERCPLEIVGAISHEYTNLGQKTTIGNVDVQVCQVPHGTKLPALFIETHVMIDIAEKRESLDHLSAAAAQGMAIVMSSEGLDTEQHQTIKQLSKKVPVMMVGGYPQSAIDAARSIHQHGPKQPGLYNYRHWR